MGRSSLTLPERIVVASSWQAPGWCWSWIQRRWRKYCGLQPWLWPSPLCPLNPGAHRTDGQSQESVKKTEKQALMKMFEWFEYHKHFWHVVIFFFSPKLLKNAQYCKCKWVVGQNVHFILLLLHLRDVKGEIQCFSRQSLGWTVPHPADLQVGQVTLRVAVHRMN